jgi:hypothetical protein
MAVRLVLYLQHMLLLKHLILFLGLMQGPAFEVAVADA